MLGFFQILGKLLQALGIQLQALSPCSSPPPPCPKGWSLHEISITKGLGKETKSRGKNVHLRIVEKSCGKYKFGYRLFQYFLPKYCTCVHCISVRSIKMVCVTQPKWSNSKLFFAHAMCIHYYQTPYSQKTLASIILITPPCPRPLFWGTKIMIQMLKVQSFCLFLLYLYILDS